MYKSFQIKKQSDQKVLAMRNRLSKLKKDIHKTQNQIKLNDNRQQSLRFLLRIQYFLIEKLENFIMKILILNLLRKTKGKYLFQS